MRAEDFHTDAFLDLRIAVETSVEPPPFEHVERRAVRVRRRRVGAVVLAASAAVLASLTLAPSAKRITAPPPHPAPAPAPAFTVRHLSFSDADHGYVVLDACPRAGDCAEGWSLARTTDQGRTWVRVRSPVDGRSFQDVDVHARGPATVAVIADNATRYVSEDGGRTWRTYPFMSNGSRVERVPAGYELGTFCPTDRDACTNQIAGSDPVTGVTRPLAHQPRLRGGIVDTVVTPDTLWVLTLTDGGSAALVESTDRGRTWRAVPAPAYTRWAQPGLLASGQGDQVYLMSRDQASYQIRRTWRRAGSGWDDVTVPDLPSTVDLVQVMPDGGLRYADGGGQAWQAGVGVTRATAAPQATMDGRRINVDVYQVVGGTMVATPVVGLRGDRLLFSGDGGAHWQVRPVRF